MKTFKIFLLVFAITGIAMAQDTIQQKHRMNNIKVEISHLLYPNSLIFSYERAIKHHQSICISGGYEEFPPLINLNTTVYVNQDLKRSGFKAGTEYRLYLKKGK